MEERPPRVDSMERFPLPTPPPEDWSPSRELRKVMGRGRKAAGDAKSDYIYMEHEVRETRYEVREKEESLDLSVSDLLDSEDAEAFGSNDSLPRRNRGKKRLRTLERRTVIRDEGEEEEEEEEEDGATALVNALFGDNDDFGSDDEEGEEDIKEPDRKRPRITLDLGLSEEDAGPPSLDTVNPRIPTSGEGYLTSAREDGRADEKEKAAGGEDHQMRIEDVTPMVYKGYSVIRNTAENIATRCLFSSNRRAAPGEPMALKVSDDTLLPFPSEALYGAWALMGREEVCVAAGSKRGSKEMLQQFSGLRGRQDCEIAPAGDRPGYFVLVGPDVSFVASPLFAYSLQVVQLNPETVQFAFNPAIPVYLLLGAVEKRSLMPEADSPFPVWLKALGNCLKDTLHVHLAASQWDWGALRRILTTEEHMPQAQDPAKTAVNAGALTLTNYSTRQQRSTFITKNISAPLRSLAKACKAGEDTLISKPSWLETVHCFSRIADLLFTDLEKDGEVLQLLRAGMPVATMSSISTWKTRFIKYVRARASYVRKSLLGQFISLEQLGLVDSQAAKRAKSQGHQGTFPLRPMSITRFLHLHPAWFATCFSWICDMRAINQPHGETNADRIRSQRLEAFRAFVFSDVLHSARQRMQRYQANAVFLFTRRYRDAYFTSNAFSRSSDAGVMEQLNPDLPPANEAGSTRSDGGEPLSEEEERAVVKKVMFFLERTGLPDMVAMTRESDCRPPTRIIVNRTYQRAAIVMARLVRKTVQNWIDGWESGALGSVLGATPPLIVKIAYVYGKSADAVKEIQDVLRPHLNGGDIATLSAHDTSAKRRASFKCARVLVLSELHRWSSTAINEMSTDFEVVSRSNAITCTHVVVLGYTGLIGNHVGEALLADLYKVAHRVQDCVDRLGGSTVSTAGLAPSLVGPDAPHVSVFDEGARTEAHLTAVWREAQLDANRSRLVCEPNLSALANNLRASLAKNRRPIVLFVFYRRAASKLRFQKVLGSSSSLYKCQTVYVRYHELSRHTDRLYGDSHRHRVDVALLDLLREEEGEAQGPTVYHINSAFAALTARLWVLGTKDDLHATYMRSDRASDRETLHIEQFPLLEETLEKELFHAPTGLLYRLSRPT